MRYILDPEDEIRILGEEEKVIKIDSQKRMLFFTLRDVTSAGIIRNVQIDKQRCVAFCFTAKDSLLGREYEVLVPENRNDYVNFTEAFRTALPQLAWQPPREDLPPLCDGNGHHFA